MARVNTPKKTGEAEAISANQATMNNNNKVQALESKRASLAEYYKGEKKVTITGSPFYRPYFGNIMPLVINGIAIHVPLNGKQYEIPETYAALFYERIQRIDAQRLIQQRLGDVSGNLEAYAGEKDFINAV